MILEAWLKTALSFCLPVTTISFMRKIGLLSDTHGFLDPSIFVHFKDCDEVWHAGDIGSAELLDQLGSFKPLQAVFGNIDGGSLRWELPEVYETEIEGVKILMTHIAGPLGKYTPELRALLEEKKPDLLVCGHSHICKVAPDQKFALLYVNPGACGRHGFHQMRTVMRLTIDSGKVSGLEVVELGKRAST